MTLPNIKMTAELRAAPDAVRRQARVLQESLAPLVGRLSLSPPQVVVTCARGSSAHAATFGKHLIERYLRIPVAAAAPSVTTIYGQRLRLEGQLFLAISQSGKSGDLIEMASVARAEGAVTACVTNDVESELACACEHVLSMAAGPELSIPATKTFIASLSALARLIAAWTEDEAFLSALERLPDRLAQAAGLDWSPLVASLARAESLVTIGRGPTLAIAREAALKLKETCNLHAEAFSGAEFLHGPIALVTARYPIVMFMPADAALDGMRRLAEDLTIKGANVLATECGDGGENRLPMLAPDHPDADAICLIQSFYSAAVRLAMARGANADAPRHLRKVTRTK